MNTTVPQGEQKSPTIGIRATTSGFSHQHIAYAHVPDVKRTKLDDKSMKCVFIGVSEECKAYMLYNLITKKIIISKDVLFDEENIWDWSNTEQQQILIDLEEVGGEIKQPLQAPLESQGFESQFQLPS